MNSPEGRIVRLFACALLVCAAPARGQVPRDIVNGGFDSPQLSTRAQNPPAQSCFLPVGDASVPGWSSTAIYATTPPTVDQMCNPLSLRPSPGQAGIELWRTGFNGVPSRAGGNFAEVLTGARFSQEVCLVSGETVQWQFSHRGRNGQDVASFNVDGTANTIVQARTGPAGGGGIDGCGTGDVTATCARAVAGTWTDYSGSFEWSGTTGIHSIGVTAVSSASGVGGQGNFVDAFSISVQPMLKLSLAQASGRESTGAAALPELVVTGVVPAAGVNVELAVQASTTATLGIDFTTPGGTDTFVVNIPSGSYDGGGGSRFPIGIQIQDDAVIEDNETVSVDLLPSPDYVLGDTQACSAAALVSASYTIVDDDVDVLTTKTVDDPTPAPGGQVVFTVTYQNNTAAPTVPPVDAPGVLDGHDATASLADALPTGITDFSWTCTATGTPAPACPAASGTGAIGVEVVLPAGDAAAGGSLTYEVTAILSGDACTAASNTSTVSPVDPFGEGDSAQPDFITPVPGGTVNNTASVDVDPVCADLQVQATNTIASGPDDLPEDTVPSGTQTTYTLTVTNLGPDAVTAPVLSNTPVEGLDCGAGNPVTCTGPAAACPASAVTVADLEAGVALGTLAPVAPDNTLAMSFDCIVQ